MSVCVNVCAFFVFDAMRWCRATLLDYVKEGFIFTGKGFKKDAHSASVYDTIGAGGGTTSYQGSSYHGTAPVEAKSSAYSDL